MSVYDSLPPECRQVKAALAEQPLMPLTRSKLAIPFVGAMAKNPCCGCEGWGKGVKCFGVKDCELHGSPDPKHQQEKGGKNIH